MESKHESKETIDDSVNLIIQSSIDELTKMGQDVQAPVKKMLQWTWSRLSKKDLLNETKKSLLTSTSDPKSQIPEILELLPPIIKRFDSGGILVQYLWSLFHSKQLTRHHVLVLTPTQHMGSVILEQVVKLLSGPMKKEIIDHNVKQITFKDKMADPTSCKQEHEYRALDLYSSFQIVSLNSQSPKGCRGDIVLCYDVSRQEASKFVTLLTGYCAISPLVICVWSGARNIEFDQVVFE